MELLLPDFIAHFEYFFVEHGLAAFAQESVDEGGSGGEEVLVDGGGLVLHCNQIKSDYK
jgi:hypothetical protein